ncbi:MAG: OmpA family protein [Alphaproteobacteria bacterium]|nr:OmpA family protein [Alphaproteobacteria bacterium]
MRRGLVVALVASAALLAVPALAAEYHYVKVADIYLPTPRGHGDIVSYDPTNGMVYVSLKDDGLAVVDTRTQKVVHTIKDIPDPNANAFDANYVYVASAEGLPQGQSGANNGTGFGTVNQLVVIDKHTWQVVDRVDTKGTSPDAVTVGDGHVYVVSDDHNWIEAYSQGAHPQLQGVWHLYPQNINHWWLDTSDFCGPDVNWISDSRHEIYQTVDSYIEVVDSNNGTIKRHFDTHVKLTGKCGTKGTWLDEKNNRLWVATTTKAGGLWVMNPNTLQLIKKLPATNGKDQMSVDPGLGLVYTFGTNGFDAYDLNAMQHVAYVNTHVGVTHTGDIDTRTHAVYVYEGKRAALGVFCPVPGPGPNGDWAVGMTAACGAMPVAYGSSSYTVYFEFNKADLTADARKIVNQAAATAKHGTARIVVDGYTDLAGTAQYNLGLSQRRAAAVRAALVADGIAARRITIHGYGKTHPAVPTPDGVREPRNRRAVVLIGPAPTT